MNQQNKTIEQTAWEFIEFIDCSINSKPNYSDGVTT